MGGERTMREKKRGKEKQAQKREWASEGEDGEREEEKGRKRKGIESNIENNEEKERKIKDERQGKKVTAHKSEEK